MVFLLGLSLIGFFEEGEAVREILWCETHDEVAKSFPGRPVQCWVEGLESDDPCPTVPMLLVPKDAPSITVSPGEAKAQRLIGFMGGRPPGRYVLVDEEER